MTSSRKIVRAFLASPGDLVEERKIAKRVVDEFNSSWADQLGYQVELVGWEQTVTSFGRPQELINRDLARCELFIGMMWKRWGTPPDTTGKFTSGFEEEFQTSIERRRRGESKPEINLFFKNVDPELLRDPGSELRKVLDFKSQLIDEKIVLFETFGGEDEFREKVQRCITRYVQSVINADSATQREREEPRSSAVSGDTQVESISAISSLSGEAAKFLLEIAPRVERREGAQELGSIDVARLRLIGSMERTSGNDEQYLGVHDANIIFANRNSIAFEDREYYALVRAGLGHFSSENAPLWFWMSALGADAGDLLILYSRYGSASIRAEAISAMRTIAEPINHKAHTRESILESWLGSDVADNIKIAALRYLADFGTLADLASIRAEFDRDNYQTRTIAVEALLRINMRESRVRAVRALIELQPLGVDAKLLDEVFSNGISLSTPLLLETLRHRNPKVRAIAAGILRKKNALTAETAESLISDDDAFVRYEALVALHNSGRRYSEQEARRILIKPRSGALGGFFGNPSDADGEACLSEFLEVCWAGLSIHELEAKVEHESLLTRSAWYVLAKRRWNVLGAKVRASVDDQHKAEYIVDTEGLIMRFGADSEIVKGRSGIEGYVRELSTRKALDLICEINDPEDLDRVRVALRDGSVPYSEKDTAYLMRWGEWEDIPLIIKSLERRNAGARRGTGLLAWGLDESHYEFAAKAIYKLGKDRLSELLSLSAPSKLKNLLILEASNSNFARLNDNDVLTLLRSKSDALRKSTALKSVRSLPKTRLKKLLNLYLSSNETYYYNVVHWLDMGLSNPKDRAIRASDLMMGRMN